MSKKALTVGLLMAGVGALAFAAFSGDAKAASRREDEDEDEGFPTPLDNLPAAGGGSPAPSGGSIVTAPKAPAAPAPTSGGTRSPGIAPDPFADLEDDDEGEPALVPAARPQEVPTVVRPDGSEVPILIEEPGAGSEDDEDDEDDTPELVPDPPLAKTEQSATFDPNGSIKLARKLLEAETSSGWKTALMPEVEAWQVRVGGLKPDGKFGRKSALVMAEEVGGLPLLRFSSHWDAKQELREYRADLNALADRLETDPNKRVHAEALRASALREQGQGFAQTPSKQSPQSIAQVLEDALNAAAGVPGGVE